MKLSEGTKFREDGKKSQKSRNLVPGKFNTFKVSSNINEVIRAVLNFLFFFYEKISHAPKALKALKALKGTKTLRQKHKTQISE